MIKPRLWITAAFAAVTLSAAAVGLSIVDVNKRVEALLAPLNGPGSSFSLTFTKLAVDAVRAIELGLKGELNLVGKVNTLDLKLKEASYSYHGRTGLPTVVLSAAAKYDFLKSYPQSELNEIAQSSAEMIDSILEDFAKEYGSAATIDAAIDELIRDAKGDVISLKLHVRGQIDLAKLPAGMDPSTVSLHSGELTAEIGRGGFSLHADIRMNPQYSAFQRENRGLKEMIDGLLSENSDTYDELRQYAEYAYQTAKYFVNRAKPTSP